MNDDWKVKPLSEVVEMNPRESLKKASVAPYLEMSAIPTNGRYHDSAVPRAVGSGTRFRDGDTLMARITPCLENGKTAQVRGLGSGIVGWGSTEYIVLRSIDQVSLPDFVYLLAREPSFREFAIQQMSGTSGRQRVAAATLADYEVAVPTLLEQERIAGLFNALDQRIEVAERLTWTLGETVAAECHAAFEARPDMGEMTLPEAVKLVNGGAYTKGASGTGRMVVRIKELNSGPSETTVYNNIKVPDDKTVNPGDVLFAWSGSLGVWRWYRDQAIVNQHIFKLIPNEQPVWLGWVHVRDALENFQDIAAGKATTMGHITKDHLVRTKVPKLSAEELAALTQRVQPLWDYQLRMGREVQTLKELRDFLLPRLLSGELRVAAAEEMAEAAS